MSEKNDNQSWNHRHPNAGENLFATPETLWEAACAYFDWCVENPIPVLKPVKGDKPETIQHMRPFTLEGLCVYLGVSTHYYKNFEAQLEDKTDEISEDFKEVINLIQNVMDDHNFTAAAAGAMDPNVISPETETEKDKTDKTPNPDITSSLN